MSFTLHLERVPRTLELSRAIDGEVTLYFIDQRKLPQKLAIRRTTKWRDVTRAIACLAVRGAPAIGAAGAAAVLLWMTNACKDQAQFARQFGAVCTQVAQTRPTAVNLQWAVNRVEAEMRVAFAHDMSFSQVKDYAYAYVQQMFAQDEETNRALGQVGAELFSQPTRFLTHCNAGSLATVYYGTALGVIYAAAEQGHVDHVFADETRPVGQGARLTVWELAQAHVPVTLICDDMCASVMAKGQVDAVVVGADRIARNGDVANKIGTYGVAVLAKYHHIPFYVAAPRSTFDLTLPSGNDIPIEQRDIREVASFVPRRVQVHNPAFDVTPAQLITGIITEEGVYKPQELERLAR